MPDIKVLCIWEVRPELQEYLQEHLGQVSAEIIFPEDISKNNLIKLAKDADIIIGWQPTKEILLAAENIKLVINPGAGVQHITDLFKELEKEGKIIPLANGHGNAYFTAEGAVALLLGHMNKIVPHHNWMAEGKWRFLDEQAKSIPLRHRKVGFLGYGHVSQYIHQFLAGYEVKFHALKTGWKEQPENLKTYTADELHEFLKNIDILIEALPKTPETIGLIGEKELKLLGPDGIIVHLGRGEIIDEKALFDALKNHTIEGAAIDVWYDYRPEPDTEGKTFPYHYPFHELENVVLSPHRCASPLDDLERWHEVVDNILRAAAGRSDFINLVDLEKGY